MRRMRMLLAAAAFITASLWLQAPAAQACSDDDCSTLSRVCRTMFGDPHCLNVAEIWTP